MIVKFDLPGLCLASSEDEENRVDVVCGHCGHKYKELTYRGKLYLYNNKVIFYAFCPKCKRFTGGPVGTVGE